MADRVGSPTTYTHARWVEPHLAVPREGSEYHHTFECRMHAVCATCGEVLLENKARTIHDW